MTRARAQRGYVLLVVLVCVAVLSLVGALVFTQSSDQLVTTVALRNQAVAAARASQGAQRALAELRMTNRPAYLAGVEALTPCASLATCPNDAAHFATIPPLDHSGNGVPLDEGGGSIYRVQLYREQPAGGGAPVTIIVSTGYYGYDPAVVPRATRYESMVMVEVGGLNPPSGVCTGYCGGGL